MVGTFYAGHDFGWMNKFLDTVPKKQRLTQSIAYGLASCMHHQYIYTKQTIFRLSHKTLNTFGINRRNILPYLVLFKKAELLDYLIKKGSSPIIQLYYLPTNYYIINNKDIKQYIIKGTGVQQCTGGLQQCTGNLYTNVQVAFDDFKQGNLPTKQGNLPTKQGNLPTKQGSLPMKQGNQVKQLRWGDK